MRATPSSSTPTAWSRRATPAVEQFGQDRLVDLLSTCAGRSADGIARRIELATIAHSPHMSDDMAIVVLRSTQ